MTQTDQRSQRHSRTGRYRSLTNFYNADPRRIQSRERDVGLWWREAPDGPLHRAAWVNDTGELYLVHLGPSEQGGGEVELLATIEDGERLDRMLEGWREHCGQPRSLTWLRMRVARFSRRVRFARVGMAAGLAGAGATLGAAGSLAAELV